MHRDYSGALVGGGGYYEEQEHHHQRPPRQKVHPLGYYYCKKGHCGIDGYCSKKAPDYQQRPIQSLHYHRRPHYTRHHFYQDHQGQSDSYHHHHGHYDNVGDYTPEMSIWPWNLHLSLRFLKIDTLLRSCSSSEAAFFHTISNSLVQSSCRIIA